MFVVQIEDLSRSNQKPSLEDYPILEQYKDILLKEMPGLPPRRDIDLTIDVILE